MDQTGTDHLWIPGTIETLLPRLVAIRRHLHQRPELSHREYLTSAYIEQQARDFGAPDAWHVGDTSLCFTIGPDANNAIAVRADIDALPIPEQNSIDYRSIYDGIMHGCGHDVHTAIVVGLLAALLPHESHLTRPIRFIFQQGEESHPSGAPLLVRAGVLEKPTVREVYGFHVWPDLKVGQIGLKVGPLMASLDGLDLLLATEAEPDDYGGQGGKDTIQIAAQVLRELEPLMNGRRLSSRRPASIAIGTMRAGIAPNRFAQHAELAGTLRALTQKARTEALSRLRCALGNAEERYGVKAVLNLEPDIRPALINSRPCVRKIELAVSQTPGTSVRFLENPLHGSEDFGWYLQERTGAYMLLGCRGEHDNASHLHSPAFNPNERAIEIGLGVLLRLIANSALRL